ncbi:MAG: hypothetical protein CMP47_12495 [Rickettsiales bacterium]|nr:hypothetical protein [Rickettsiales bacterium]
MKLKHTTTAVETNNVTEGNTFGIKSSPKTFAILSSGLYSDKIGAVVRELCCNAYDSHTERNGNIKAGRATKHTAPEDKNLRVHFPTTFDPFFSVRDFGIGLTPEDVENIYTVYFESTKQDSNDYVGALGLGSKSPFSYAKSFNVIATKNGHRVIYTMFINAQGIPQPAKLDEGPVESFYMDDEEIPEEEFYDGVEVKVPAEPNDAHSFCDAAEEVFQYFAVCPDMVNYTGSTITYYKDRSDVEEFIEGVYIANRGYRDRQYAIQGNVAYPINLKQNDFNRAIKDIEKFDEEDRPDTEFTTDEIEELYRFYDRVFSNYTFYVKFNIGDLDVAASREELSYDASTIMSILVQLKRIQAHIQSKFDEHMENFESKWDKARELYRIGAYSSRYDLSSLEKLYRQTRSYIPYMETVHLPQITTESSSGYNHSSQYVEYTLDYSSIKVPKEKGFTIRMCGSHVQKRFFQVHYNETNPPNYHGFCNNNRILGMADTLLFIVNDTKRGGATLAKAYFQEVSNKERCALLEPEKRGDTEEIDKFIEDFKLKMDDPGYVVKYLSDIKEEHPDLTKSTSRPKANIGYYDLYEAFTGVAAIRTSVPDNFETDKIVYIPFKQQKPYGGNLEFDALTSLSDNPDKVGDIGKVVSMLDQLDTLLADKMPRVIGLNQNMLKQVDDYDNWVSAVDFIVEQYSSLFGNKKKRQAIESKIIEKRKTNDILDLVDWPLYHINTDKLLDKMKDVDSLADAYNVIKIQNKGREHISCREELYMRFHDVDYTPQLALDFNERYPMLEYIDDERSWDQHDEKIVDAIFNYFLMCNQGESNE